MADVLKTVHSTPVRGEEATAKVVDFLRRMANDIESGEEPEAQKAILIFYKDVGEQFAIRSRFCNCTSIERAGMMALAKHDTLSDG